MTAESRMAKQADSKRPCTAQTMDKKPRNMLNVVIMFGRRYTPLRGFLTSGAIIHHLY